MTTMFRSTPSSSAPTALSWRRSSYSTGMNNCVETALISPGLLAVRDSKNAAGPAVTFSSTAWSVFVEHLRTPAPGPQTPVA